MDQDQDDFGRDKLDDLKSIVKEPEPEPKPEKQHCDCGCYSGDDECEDDCDGDENPEDVEEGHDADEFQEEEREPDPPYVEYEDEKIPKEPDPFLAVIEKMFGVIVEDVTLPVETPAPADFGDFVPLGGTKTHEWLMAEKLFSDEPYRFKCKKCAKSVDVKSDQSFEDVLTEQKVDPECSGS